MHSENVHGTNEQFKLEGVCPWVLCNTVGQTDHAMLWDITSISITTTHYCIRQTSHTGKGIQPCNQAAAPSIQLAHTAADRFPWWSCPSSPVPTPRTPPRCLPAWLLALPRTLPLPTTPCPSPCSCSPLLVSWLCIRRRWWLWIESR